MASDFSRRHFLAGSTALGTALAVGLPRGAQAADNITYWHHFTSQSEMEGLAAVAAVYDAEGDHTVTPEGIPNAEYMSKITTATVAGSLPDTMMITAERLADMHALGAVMPLTDRINGWANKADFPQAAWDGITLGGDIYGIPAFTFVNWAYYRKDWFEEAGLELPTTMEEFREAAIKLTDPSRGRFGFGLRGGDGGQSFLHDVLDSYGALDYSDGKASLDTDKAREALAFYTGLYTTDNVVPESSPNDSYRQIMEGFKTGQTGMIWHHTGSLVELTSVLNPDQIGTFVRPAGPAARVARIAFQYNGLSPSANADPSWDWVTLWGSPDAAVALLQATGYFPASLTAAQDPRITGNPIYQAAIDSVGIGTPYPQIVGLTPWLKDDALAEMQKVMVGRATVDEAVDAMARSLDRAMR